MNYIDTRVRADEAQYLPQDVASDEAGEQQYGEEETQQPLYADDVQDEMAVDVPPSSPVLCEEDGEAEYKVDSSPPPAQSMSIEEELYMLRAAVRRQQQQQEQQENTGPVLKGTTAKKSITLEEIFNPRR